MAESILTSINFAGGAINLNYTEILYSFIAIPYWENISYSTIKSYGWKCAIVYHPHAINPFICFSTFSIFDKKYMTNINGVDPSGGSIPFLDSNGDTYFKLMERCSLFLFA